MKENAEINRNERKQKFELRELFKGYVWKPLAISMAIMFFQQFSGINAIIYFSVTIFQSAGSVLNSHYEGFIIGFVQLIATAMSGFLVKY